MTSTGRQKTISAWQHSPPIPLLEPIGVDTQQVVYKAVVHNAILVIPAAAVQSPYATHKHPSYDAMAGPLTSKPGACHTWWASSI
jgi:hypothetical protein